MKTKTVKIQGGLGNQLFGLAFARSLRLISAAPVALDVSSYRWDRYGSRFVVGDIADRIGGLTVVDRPLLGNRLSSAVMRHAPLGAGLFARELLPLPATFDIAAYANRGGYFDGYWQDEAYILGGEAWARLFGDFIQHRAAAAVVAGEGRDAVVIHYRTYKEEKRLAFSRTPGRDYFRDAIAAVERATGPVSRILVVSDDPSLALERIGDLGREAVVSAGRGWADDMTLLLNARALILTNSSFSWWAGYAGRADIVTYPRRGELFHYPMPAARFTCC